MNKADLIDTIAVKMGVDKKTANHAVEVVLETVTRTVAKGEKVALTGFGVFEKIDRPARMGRNPQTGERVRVKKTSVPKFRPGTQFKGVVSGAVKLAKETGSAAKATAKATAASAGKTASRASGRAGGAATKGTGTTKKTAATKKSAAGRTTKRTAAKSTAARGSTGRSSATKKTTAKSTGGRATKSTNGRRSARKS